ncbi:ABC Superfamily [Phytophthora palmivora]|uniref:ABC Superfamily n=1 Tax=Phytophthora palmivora TaxID=4796 RepID=A0A2P4YSD0_9STRA|nr:ABC Superfamily [Phytophthora palmivora]
MEGKNCSATALDEFMTHYERYDKSIVKAMMTAYGGEFFLWGLAMLFSTACGLFAPVVLNHVIGALSMVEIDLTDLSVWLGIFFVSRFVNAILSVQMNYALEMIALRLTVALKTLLFQKAMRRRLQTKNGSGVGEISVPSLLGQAIIHMYW